MIELGSRRNQEDCIYPPLGGACFVERLFILCDGLGGHERGEVASSVVCDTMSRFVLNHSSEEEIFRDDIFIQALAAAYDALDFYDDDGDRKMGTTLAFLMIHAGGAFVAHIGDSRVYQIRPSRGDNQARIVFKTIDHSLVNDLVKAGELNTEDAKTFPHRNVITRAMMPHQQIRSAADIAHLTDVQGGDYFFLCSDGILEHLVDEDLLFILTKDGMTDNEKMEMVRQVTADSKDNHSAHLVHILNNLSGMYT